MESGGEDLALADEERDIADPSNVIYLVEDIKPDVSNLSCEGVVQDCLVKREDQEELLCSNKHHNDVRTGTSEDDVTIKHEIIDYEKRYESNLETNQILVGEENDEDFDKKKQFETLSGDKFGLANNNQKEEKKSNNEKKLQCNHLSLIHI